MHFTYTPVTEDDFYDMYECLPPDIVRVKTLTKIMQDLGETFQWCFMNSEPVRHVEGRPTYNCYIAVVIEGEESYCTIGDVVNE